MVIFHPAPLPPSSSRLVLQLGGTGMTDAGTKCMSMITHVVIIRAIIGDAMGKWTEIIIFNMKTVSTHDQHQPV